MDHHGLVVLASRRTAAASLVEQASTGWHSIVFSSRRAPGVPSSIHDAAKMIFEAALGDRVYGALTSDGRATGGHSSSVPL